MAERNCKKCFHYKSCKEVASHSGYGDISYTESQCKHFIPTADVVEVPKWIDVNERLPEPNEKDESDYFMKAYLVARCNGFTMHTALWNGENWILWTKGTVLKDVTHWMPLPEPPSGAEMDGGVNDG